MRKMGFHEKWVKLVILSVSTFRFRIDLHKTLLLEFVPSERSLFLFFLCVEGLSSILEHVENYGVITGIRVVRYYPRIIHLFFADDVILCCKAKEEEIENLRLVFQIYE